MEQQTFLDEIYKVDNSTDREVMEHFWNLSDSILNGVVEIPINFDEEEKDLLLSEDSTDETAFELTSSWMTAMITHPTRILLGTRLERYRTVVAPVVREHPLYPAFVKDPTYMAYYTGYFIRHEGQHAEAANKTGRWIGSALITIEYNNSHAITPRASLLPTPLAPISSINTLRKDIYDIASAPEGLSGSDKKRMADLERFLPKKLTRMQKLRALLGLSHINEYFK
jgi:hypothetical protein